MKKNTKRKKKQSSNNKKQQNKNNKLKTTKNKIATKNKSKNGKICNGTYLQCLSWCQSSKL